MKRWLKRFQRYAIDDGNLSSDFSYLLMAVVLAVLYAFLELELEIPWWLRYTAIMVAVVCGAVVSYSSSARAKGLKPFTNDPLGWRKAKRSYYEDVDSDTD